MSEQANRSVDQDRGSGAARDSSSARLLLAAEQAVDIGSRILSQGRSHIGALIGKGDRDFATDVDLRIESAIRASLAQAAPEIPFLGEEEDREEDPGGHARWVLDPIDGTINFARDSPTVLDLPVAGDRRAAGARDRRRAVAGGAIHRASGWGRVPEWHEQSRWRRLPGLVLLVPVRARGRAPRRRASANRHGRHRPARFLRSRA
jgi:Inositol monophosphatase family